jgi:hypothetical protein
MTIQRSRMIWFTVAGAILLSTAAADRANSQQPNNSGEPAPNQARQDPAGWLTRDELKACMKRAVEVDAFNKKMVAPTMALEQEREKLQAKKNALQTAERAVNRNDQNTVDEFNVRAQELKAAREAFNAAVARYNAARGDGHDLIHAYNMACAGALYSKDLDNSVRSEFGLLRNPMTLIPAHSSSP